MVKLKENADYMVCFRIDAVIKKAYWLDDGRELSFTQNGEDVIIHTLPYRYGENAVVHVAKIEIE